MHRRQFLASSALGLAALRLSRFAYAGNAASTPLALPEALKNNPLLDFSGLPKFSAFTPADVAPAIDFLIAHNHEQVEKIAAIAAPDWDNFFVPLSDAADKLNRAWGIVVHLNNVKNSDALREAHDAALAKITDYSSWLGQHEALYQGFVKLKEAAAFAAYTPAQQKAITDALRDFRLSGIGLPADKQQTYRDVSKRLAELSSQFEKNVLDANMGWSKTVASADALKGLTEHDLAAAKEAAESKGEQGYRLTLDYPSYSAVVTRCDDRALREEIYRAYATRASDQGPNAGKWDNSAVINEILELRHTLAQTLGFATYADYSLATKMADSPEEVMQFLTGLVQRSRAQARAETDELRQWAKETYGVDDLQPWDIAYYSEKQKNARYAVDDQTLRPYFPEAKVQEGLFAVAKKLFGIDIREKSGVDVWDASVRFYEIYENGAHIASFYLDPYAREHKNGGAWMDNAITRRRLPDGSLQKPVAYLVCNYGKPVGEKPALLRHDDAVTLFHEFGHGLHHMLTRVDVAEVSGINGVAWDAVEFPSQMMENWCWQKESLPLISAHYQTGAPLPDELLTKMLEAKNYLAARALIRQLEFGLLDFRLNYEDAGERSSFVARVMQGIRDEVSVTPDPEWARRAHSFTHIFSGGYAAGYYSYLWAEVLAADAFSRFAADGILNEATGKAYRDTVFADGGSRPPMQVFEAFMGRKPTLDALLKQRGITG